MYMERDKLNIEQKATSTFTFVFDCIFVNWIKFNIKTNRCYIWHGPGLFDLTCFLSTMLPISLFADDAKLSLSVNNSDDCQISQNELNNVNDYFNANYMKINEKKTKPKTFHRCNFPIKFDFFWKSRYF